MEVIFCGKDSLDQNHPIEIDGEPQMQVTNVVLNCLCVSELVMGCRLPPRRERQFSVAESNSRTYSSVSHYFLSLNTQHSYQLKECLKLEGGSWHNISYCLFLVLLDSFTTSVEFTPPWKHVPGLWFVSFSKET